LLQVVQELQIGGTSNVAARLINRHAAEITVSSRQPISLPHHAAMVP
jgi:hypothetical protein